jgi:hypothetical protein
MGTGAVPRYMNRAGIRSMTTPGLASWGNTADDGCISAGRAATHA